MLVSSELPFQSQIGKKISLQTSSHAGYESLARHGRRKRGTMMITRRQVITVRDLFYNIPSRRCAFENSAGNTTRSEGVCLS